jgi:PAS domain S-box-containing protein
MKLYKNISLRSKFLIPSLGLIIVSVLLIVAISQGIFSSRMHKELSRIAEDKVASFYKSVDQIGQRSVKIGMLTAINPDLQRAYNGVAKDSIRFETGSEMLQSGVLPVIQSVNAIYGQKVRATFYYPPARVMLRTWSGENGDEMSYLRKSVLHVNETRQPVLGIEMGKEGLEIRGLVPVFSNYDKEYQGVVEISTSLDEAIQDFEHSNEEYAIYVDLDEYRGIEKLLSLKIDSSLMNGNLMPIENSTTFPFSKSFANQLTKFHNQGDNIFTNIENNNLYIYFKLRDYDSKSIGVGVLQLNVSEYLHDLSRIQMINLLVAGFFILLGIFFLTWTVALVMRPVRDVITALDELAKGNLYQVLKPVTKDEIAHIAHAFNRWMEHLQQMYSTLGEMAKGNFKSEIQALGDDDILTYKLIELNKKLANEQEHENQRKMEEAQTQWISNGLSKFNEIIRLNSTNLEKLSDAVLKELVDYLDGNQGGFFTYNDDNKDDIYLDLISSYAYSKKRFQQKQVRLGEGLLGMCAIEKYTMYKTSIPEGYTRIRSGLGEANPNYLLFVPVKLEEEVLAVLEIASFNEIQKYQIDFVEYLANTLASSLSIIKSNRLSEKLLEQSRRQAEELAAQEIEMRQNFEILRATEQEATEKVQRSEGFVDSMKNYFLFIETTPDGIIRAVNSKLLETMKYLHLEVEKEHLANFIADADVSAFKQSWLVMQKNGVPFEKEFRFKQRNSICWVHAYILPQKNASGSVSFINLFLTDIHLRKTENLAYEREVKTINDTLIKAEYKPDGTVVGDNSMFIKLMGYSMRQSTFSNVFDFIPIDKSENFRKIWNLLQKGVPNDYVEKITRPNGDEKWFQGVFIPIMDIDGKIQRIIFLAMDITRHKISDVHEYWNDLATIKNDSND